MMFGDRRTFRLGFMADDPEIGRLTDEIRALERQRENLIADRLAGRTRMHMLGFDYITDPSMPEDTLEFRDRDGRTVARIVNLR